jgi:ribosome-binding factor A
MKPKKPLRPRFDLLCGKLHDDDCVDPKEFFRPVRAPRGANRKALQLCRQVADTLNQVLSGECGDESLRNLQVVSVAPAPDASQLLVLVAPVLASEAQDAELVRTCLASASGRLRREVAAAITRRRAPKLLFQYVIGPSAEGGFL